MDKRHAVPAGVTPGAQVTLTGAIKTRGRSEFAPLIRKKMCHVEVEVDEMDITVVAYEELADRLAGLATATAIRVTGKLHIAKWDTGDGQIHQRMGVNAETINAVA